MYYASGWHYFFSLPRNPPLPSTAPESFFLLTPRQSSWPRSNGYANDFGLLFHTLSRSSHPYLHQVHINTHTPWPQSVTDTVLKIWRAVSIPTTLTARLPSAIQIRTLKRSFNPLWEHCIFFRKTWKKTTFQTTYHFW